MSCCVNFTDCCVPACKSGFARLCPRLYGFLWSKHNEFRGLKFGLGFLFGACLGIALHLTVINKLKYPAYDRSVLGAAVTLLIALGFGMSVQIRCIMILVLPNFFGKNGRSVLTSLAMLYLLSGPVANIVNNAQESARSISCTAALTYNHSKEIFTLLHKPFTDAFNDMAGQADVVQKLAVNVRKEFESFEEEIEDEDDDDKTMQSPKPKHKQRKPGEHVDGKKAGEKYKMKMDFRCDDIFSMAVEKCQQTFRETERKCRNKIKLPGIKDIFCLPLKLTVMCNIVKGFDYLCDSSPAIAEGLGETYAAIEDTFQDFQKNFKVSLKWKVTQIKELFLNRTSVEELQQSVLHEFHMRKQILDVFLGIAKGLMSFTFVLVFKSAHSYNSSYLRDKKFDNVYLTSYFRKIDERRKRQNKRTVLPMKKVEKNDLIEPTRWALRKQERSKLIKGTVRLLMHVIISFVIVAFDYLFFTMIDIIQRHTEMDFKFSGEHALRIGVKGDGAVAQLFRHLLRSFDNKHEIDRVSSNRHCLPQATQLHSDVIHTIFGMWATVWLLLYFEAYGLRLRRLICAFFYPKVEKGRIISLYNEHLKKRVGFLRLMRKKVRKLAKEKKLEEKADWVKCCGLCRKRTCLICDDSETKTFHRCQTKNCKFIYCRECWGDVKESCYACEPYFGDSDESESDSEA